MIRLRAMRPDDIATGLALCRHNGWNQVARDWEVFLRQSPDRCLVAVDDLDQVIGTATTIRYDNFSWIGMVLVNPAHQKQGIGHRLLTGALQLLSESAIVKLDATPAGREVYRKLGFVDEYVLCRMHCPGTEDNKRPDSAAKTLENSDVSDILRMDREVFGADRATLIRWMWEGAKELAFRTSDQGRLSGYCFGRYGQRFTHLGPVIAESDDVAVQLVVAALKNCVGPAILDVPQSHENFIRQLVQLGFTEQRQLIRMFHGPAPGDGIATRQLATLGPEFG